MQRGPGGPVASPFTVTLSGNEITDAVRTTGTAGDGVAPPDSSMGIWQAATNLEASAGADVSFAAATTGYTTGGTNTIASSTEQAKFETHSCKATYQNNATLLDIALTLAAVAHAASRWLYIPTNYDGQGVRVQFANFAGAAGTLTADANMSLRDQWQRVEVPNVTPAGGDLAGNVQVINTGTAPTAGRFIYIDGCQTEAGRISTPFTLTSRAVGRIRLPASLIDESRAWVALRLRMGWGNAVEPGGGSGFPSFFEWRDDSSNRLSLYYVEGSNQLALERVNAGSSTARLLAQALAAGDLVTLIIAWTPTQVRLSVNGAAFVVTNGANIPTIAATTFDLGTNTLGAALINSTYLWAITGRGTLGDAQAAAIHANGNTDPTPALVPLTAHLSGIWAAATSAATAYD